MRLLTLTLQSAAVSRSSVLPCRRSVLRCPPSCSVTVCCILTWQRCWFNVIFQDNRVTQYQNVSILDFIGAKDDRGGGDNCSHKTCKALVKTSPPTNKHPAFYRPNALLFAQSTVSQHWRKVARRLTARYFVILGRIVFIWPLGLGLLLQSPDGNTHQQTFHYPEKVHHTPLESVRRCSSPSPRLWASCSAPTHLEVHRSDLDLLDWWQRMMHRMSG